MLDDQRNARRDTALRSGQLLLSAVFGAATAFLVYALFLQTTAISIARLLAALILSGAVALVHYAIAGRWGSNRLRAAGTSRRLGLVLLIVIIFFPLLYRPPTYPLSPLLRPWTDVAVQFEVPTGSQPLALSADAVKLVMGKEVLNAGSFERAGPWQASASQLGLPPGNTASLRWTGTVPETTLLSIRPPSTDVNLTIYWDDTRTAMQLHAGEQAPILINRKASLPWGYNLAFLASSFVFVAVALGWISLLLGQQLELQRRISRLQVAPWTVIVLSVMLALVTVKLQLDSLPGGLDYLTTTQVARHAAVMQGQAPDPWQYRVLSEVIAEGMIRLFRVLRMPAAVSAAFIALRLLQNAAIFLVAFALYRRIAGSSALGLLAVLVLTGSMLNAFYDNDLSFNTYFDLLFYLLCALFLLARNYRAVVILTVFAALNRETSGLIPFMMAGAILGDNSRPGFKKYMPALLSLAIFTVIFVGLRVLFPPRPLYIPYRHAPGAALLLYNLTRSFTWQQLLATLGLVPLVGLIFFFSWPPFWQRLLVIVVPTWFVVHAFASIMAETRLFLVPQAIVFIPGALFALCVWLNVKQPPASPSLQSERGAS